MSLPYTFTFENNQMILQYNDKKYVGYMTPDLFQCEKDIEMFKKEKSIPLIASVALKNPEQFHTKLEERNDIPTDIGGAGPSSPRNHLRVDFSIKNKEEEIPVYFYLMLYDN